MNPLYESMNGNMLQQFQQFKQNFHGDPQQQVQQLLNSGRITQSQYDAAVQKAKALQRVMGLLN